MIHAKYLYSMPYIVWGIRGSLYQKMAHFKVSLNDIDLSKSQELQVPSGKEFGFSEKESKGHHGWNV